MRDVFRARKRFEVALFVGFALPRTVLAEDGRVVIPGAQAPFVPNEVIAHARASAHGTLRELFFGMRQRIEHVFR